MQQIKLKCIFFFFFCSAFWGGCSKREVPSTTMHGNVINVSEAILNINKEILLSEWIDSVTYVPLETRPHNLLGNYISAKLTPEFIFFHNRCFDRQGKYINSIGTFGQGPCEEAGTITNVVYIDSCFYTKGIKLIEYDFHGTCTGKERSLYRLYGDSCAGRFVRLDGLMRSGESLMSYNDPDTVFFFNTDFEIVGTYPIMEWPVPKYTHRQSGKYDKLTTLYNDTVLFYNYYTDTVYCAKNNTLIPKWVIKLDEKDKVSSDYIYRHNELLDDAFKWWESGKLEQAEICKMVDNRINVANVYETNHYLFMTVFHTQMFRELRELPETDELPMLLCVEKSTGKTTCVKTLIDDLGGMDRFFPGIGIIDEKMVSLIWPHELDEFIKRKQERNQKVDVRLLELQERVDIEDNPILIFAHLKQ